MLVHGISTGPVEPTDEYHAGTKFTRSISPGIAILCYTQCRLLATWICLIDPVCWFAPSHDSWSAALLEVGVLVLHRECPMLIQRLGSRPYLFSTT